MTIALDDLTAAEPKRDRYGRPLIVPRGGGKPKAYTRPTTIADTLDDRYNLEQWKQRQVLLGTVARPDLHALAATTAPDDKKALNKLCEQLMDAAASDKGANMGTAVHAAVEAYNRGTPFNEIPSMFHKDLNAYRSAILRVDGVVDPDHVEQFVVNDWVGAAGTFDMRLYIDGTWYVADLKTGTSVEWSAKAFAIQLAIYQGHTSIYDWATETHGDPLDLDADRGIIVHLPAGSGECTLHWIDLDAGREALEHALWVRKWRSRKDLLSPVSNVNATVLSVKATKLPKPDVPDLPAGHGEPADDYDELKAEGDAVKASGAKDVLQLMLRWRGQPKGTLRWNTNGDDGMIDLRRVAISRAALALARFCVRTVGQFDGSDDALDATARAVLEEVLDPDDIQTHEVGRLLGTLTPDQAKRLKEVCDE